MFKGSAAKPPDYTPLAEAHQSHMQQMQNHGQVMGEAGAGYIGGGGMTGGPAVQSDVSHAPVQVYNDVFHAPVQVYEPTQQIQPNGRAQQLPPQAQAKLKGKLQSNPRLQRRAVQAVQQQRQANQPYWDQFRAQMQEQGQQHYQASPYYDSMKGLYNGFHQRPVQQQQHMVDTAKAIAPGVRNDLAAQGVTRTPWGAGR
jgi:hypothetical protein